jgi:phosphonate transport system permease protein
MIRLVNVLFSALATALIFFVFGALIEWLYQINDPVKVYLIPAAVGALIGGIFALQVKPKQLLPMGMVIYTVMRTILNAVRSIEPLIYVIVFVVWVGIGPFAGALALALHTIAALAKLYSEQVESILPGPLEAVTATGATRIQTIMYAVVPQIIPPYISFTMYRWDINVRMSTIIGFAGGGGIGFLLQQNIRLLDYRAAAVQMIAIALVVASMDYVSSALRKRFV